MLFHTYCCIHWVGIQYLTCCFTGKITFYIRLNFLPIVVTCASFITLLLLKNISELYISSVIYKGWGVMLYSSSLCQKLTDFSKLNQVFTLTHLILLIEINFNCFFEEYKMYSTSLNELYNQYMNFE